MARNPRSQQDMMSRIEEVVAHEKARELVAAYFDANRPFAGFTFTTLGENAPATVGLDDLLAVSLLDVRITAPAVRWFQDPVHREHVSRQLESIDPEVTLWEASEDLLERAEGLWETLVLRDGPPGIGPVTAGKLLARKRPRLIPIWDEVVDTYLRPPQGAFWRSLAESLRDSELRASIDSLRPGAGERVDVGTLRLLDVAVWMRFSGSKAAHAVRISLEMD